MAYYCNINHLFMSNYQKKIMQQKQVHLSSMILKLTILHIESGRFERDIEYCFNYYEKIQERRQQWEN